MTSTDPADSAIPKSRAEPRSIRPAGSGRAAVRFILASRSASHHWLSAADPPAPSAIHKIAIVPITGSTGTGAASRPHSPVKITRLITRGLVSDRKSRQSAGKGIGWAEAVDIAGAL